MPRQVNRQIDTIPEYEPDIVPNQLPTIQSNNNNRRLPLPDTNPITNTNKALIKRPENQTTPLASKTDAFVHVNIDKNIFTGMNIYIYKKLL
jgi:hypothetical protein